MRYRIFASASLFAAGVLASGCHNRTPATAPTPTKAQADREAAERESARLRQQADSAAAAARVEADRVAKAHAEVRSTLATPVRFQFDRSELTDDALQLLDAKVAALQANPSIHLRIEGNADDKGSDEYNMALSQRRAAMAERYFTERGIDASRLQIAAYGEERPSCTTSRDEACRAQNRRDEFVILSGM